jgi:hypothetical protein
MHEWGPNGNWTAGRGLASLAGKQPEGLGCQACLPVDLDGQGVGQPPPNSPWGHH